MASLKPFFVLGAIGLLLAILNPTGARSGAAALTSIVIQLPQAALGLMYVRAALRVHDGNPVEPRRFDELLHRLWSYLLTVVLLGLLVVPGVLWALRYGYAGFVGADGPADPIAAKERARGCFYSDWQRSGASCSARSRWALDCSSPCPRR